MQNSKHERKAYRIAKLLAKYHRKTITPLEEDELSEWVGASDKNMRVFEEFIDVDRINAAFELLNIDERMAPKYEHHEPHTKRIHIFNWFILSIQIERKYD